MMYFAIDQNDNEKISILHSSGSVNIVIEKCNN